MLSVRANTTIQVLQAFQPGRHFSRRREREAVSISCGGSGSGRRRSSSRCSTLSGGNQQKVSLTRPFLRGVHVILADEPTQGVDVGSRFEIYEALRGKAREGRRSSSSRAIRSSSRALCDRVVVMSRGRIVDEIPSAELSERIIEAIVGSRDEKRGSRQRGRVSVNARSRRHGAAFGAEVSRLDAPGPAGLLILAMGAYTSVQAGRVPDRVQPEQPLVSTMPLALVAIGQTNALLVGGFDISVAALMTSAS